MKKSSILIFIVFVVMILIFTAGTINTSKKNLTNNQLSNPSNSGSTVHNLTHTPDIYSNNTYSNVCCNTFS